MTILLLQLWGIWESNKMQNCNNIEEVRININSIDEEIVKLIAKRGHFVKQAAKFKNDMADVKASKRVEEVILKVKKFSKNNWCKWSGCWKCL